MNKFQLQVDQLVNSYKKAKENARILFQDVEDNFKYEIDRIEDRIAQLKGKLDSNKMKAREAQLIKDHK